MGPFFYSKKEIPANSCDFNKLSFFKFSLETPPSATIFFLEKFDKILNLLIPR